MSYDDDDDKPFSLRVFLRRNGAGIGIAGGLVALLSVGVFFVASGEGSAPAKKIPETLQVRLEAPPPPPPPPPPQQVEQPKMIEQPKMAEPEFKPATPRQKDEPPPKADNPDNKPPSDAPLGLDAEAEGPGDSFNLAGNPGGGGLLGGGGGGGGSRWGWYATIVQNRIESALRNNDKTKQASARTEIRLWLDASGRIERAQLVKTTGDAEVDRAIEDQVLPGLAFNEAPPKEMPMPVVVRLTARRPS